MFRIKPSLSFLLLLALSFLASRSSAFAVPMAPSSMTRRKQQQPRTGAGAPFKTTAKTTPLYYSLIPLMDLLNHLWNLVLHEMYIFAKCSNSLTDQFPKGLFLLLEQLSFPFLVATFLWPCIPFLLPSVVVLPVWLPLLVKSC